jgi:hypothetical protein
MGTGMTHGAVTNQASVVFFQRSIETTAAEQKFILLRSSFFPSFNFLSMREKIFQR